MSNDSTRQPVLKGATRNARMIELLLLASHTTTIMTNNTESMLQKMEEMANLVHAQHLAMTELLCAMNQFSTEFEEEVMTKIKHKETLEHTK